MWFELGEILLAGESHVNLVEQDEKWSKYRRDEKKVVWSE
jgi:hypothetical protein